MVIAFTSKNYSIITFFFKGRMTEFVNIFDTIQCKTQCNGETFANTNSINLTIFLVLKILLLHSYAFGENMNNIHFKAVLRPPKKAVFSPAA